MSNEFVLGILEIIELKIKRNLGVIFFKKFRRFFILEFLVLLIFFRNMVFECFIVFFLYDYLDKILCLYVFLSVKSW